MVARLTIDATDLKDLSKRMRAEANGKDLRKDLIRELRAAVEPGVSAARGAAMSLPSSGAGHPGRALRSSVASKIRPQVRLGGRSPGVSVKASSKGMPRGFDRAARWLNRASWRHPVFGRGVHVTQTGRAGWFDNVFKGRTAVYRRAVTQAMDRMGRRIARGR